MFYLRVGSVKSKVSGLREIKMVSKKENILNANVGSRK